MLCGVGWLSFVVCCALCDLRCLVFVACRVLFVVCVCCWTFVMCCVLCVGVR